MSYPTLFGRAGQLNPVYFTEFSPLPDMYGRGATGFAVSGHSHRRPPLPTEDNRLTAFSNREVMVKGWRPSRSPQEQRETNEHVPEDKQVVPVFPIGVGVRCSNRLELAK